MRRIGVTDGVSDPVDSQTRALQQTSGLSNAQVAEVIGQRVPQVSRRELTQMPWAIADRVGNVCPRDAEVEVCVAEVECGFQGRSRARISTY